MAFSPTLAFGAPQTMVRSYRVTGNPADLEPVGIGMGIGRKDFADHDAVPAAGPRQRTSIDFQPGQGG